MALGGETPIPSDLASLCTLARLRLAAGRRDELTARLAAVIDAFASLAAVDTDGTDAHDRAAAAPLRPDTVGPVLSAAEALANARGSAADCFLVPRVVEG